MRNLVLSIIIFCVITSKIIAQHSISSNYTNNLIGHDIDLNYNYQFKKSKFSLGLSFLMNRDWQNNPNWNAYHKVFHSFNIIDRFGYRFSYTYLVPIKKSKTDVYFVTDLRYRFGQTRTLTPLPTDFILQNKYKLYAMKEEISTKIHALSNQLGIGLNSKLFTSFFINIRASIGFDSFINTSIYVNNANFKFYQNEFFVLSYLFSVGLEYKFNKKKM